MKDLKFKNGDVVKHKAADFKMVVVSANELHGTSQYKCSWFNAEIKSEYSGFHYSTFTEQELEVVNS